MDNDCLIVLSSEAVDRLHRTAPPKQAQWCYEKKNFCVVMFKFNHGKAFLDIFNSHFNRRCSISAIVCSKLLR